MPISRSKNKHILITMGDPAGIGPEIIAKALTRPAIRAAGKITIIGDARIYERCATLRKNISFIDCNLLTPKNCPLGTPSAATGKASLEYLRVACDLLKQKTASALVTAPLSKAAVCYALPGFHGHTEFLQDEFHVPQVEMMFVAGNLRTVLVTRHIALADVPKNISTNNIYRTLRLTNTTLTALFKVRNPRIAVCGLNPHAGEGGLMGTEEKTAIIPAIKKAQQNGITALGPFAADMLFTPLCVKKYDAVIAMYHDQGLVALKSATLASLVNLTIGLPFIRTSPAHGTAFDIAGKKIADPSSLCAAIMLAGHLA